jgi:ABC-type nitrate/sulfonate/bicarbonate transport system ATPase subunit
LHISELSVRLGGRILFSPITLKIAAGEIVAVIGPSGVGKTSLLRAVAGLLDESSVTGKAWARENPAIMFQEDRLLPWCDLLSNVLVPIELQRELEPSDVAVARELLRRMRLEGADRLLPDKVSGGMRQRAAIARALVRSAAVLLLDEPFTALDFDTKIDCQRLLLESVSASGSAVLLVTHDIDDAVSLAQRLLIMSAYPASSTIREIGWLGRPSDPLRSRQSSGHFEIVREILSYVA